jgi:hypothetical protein
VHGIAHLDGQIVRGKIQPGTNLNLVRDRGGPGRKDSGKNDRQPEIYNCECFHG